MEGLENKNTRPFWKYVKSKRQDANGIAPLKKGTTLVNDSKGKAEILLDQFKSALTTPSKGDFPDTRIKSTQSIKKITIDQNGLTKLLKQVDPSKASGPDNIPNRILRECAEKISPILKIIF